MSRIFLNTTLTRQFFLSWTLALVVVMVLFMAIKPTLKRVVFQRAMVESMLTDDQELEVGTESVNGYTQVYYLFDNKKIFITQGNFNNTDPSSQGKFITWSKLINGAGQIMLYHIPTETTLQLTNSRTNLHPQVNSLGQVVWEGWIREKWQIFMFNGINLQRITKGNLATNPDINSNFIVFSRKSATGEWSAEQYSIFDGGIKEVKKGISAKYPSINQDGIFFQHLPTDSEADSEELSSRPDGDMPFFSLINKKEITANDIHQEMSNSISLNSGQNALEKVGLMIEPLGDDELNE